jgi:F-type H+-transporting ATPase subunit delta
LIKTRLAKRYARALFELAKEAGRIEEIGRDLGVVDSLFQSDANVREGLSSPIVNADHKLKILDALIGATGIDKTVGNFLRVLLEARKMVILPQTAVEYAVLADQATGKLRGVVTAPLVLSGEEISRLSAALTKSLGKEVILESKADPSLLGGVVAKVGNMVYDASVRTQLQRMKESLIKG